MSKREELTREELVDFIKLRSRDLKVEPPLTDEEIEQWSMKKIEGMYAIVNPDTKWTLRYESQMSTEELEELEAMLEAIIESYR